MFKKIVSILLIFVLLNLHISVLYADDELEENFSNTDLNDILATSTSNYEININSRIAVAFDRKSKNVIWGKNENKKSAMASTTKIMTAIIAIENADLNSIVEVSAKASGTGGSRLGLRKGDKIVLKDLLYGLMLRSGNDAAVAVAEYISGSVQDFAILMNNKAAEIGLSCTNFVTPHGLDNPNHYTTATELAILTDYALNNELFCKIVATKSCTIYINSSPKLINNTNELLGNVEGLNGVKTGFTGNAGRCLVTSISRDGFDIIVVVLQADTKKDRGKDSIEIINYVYKNYEQFNIKKFIENEFESWRCN